MKCNVYVGQMQTVSILIPKSTASFYKTPKREGTMDYYYTGPQVL